MGKLILTNVHPQLDGELEFDDTEYNKWELHCIKQLTGLAGLKLSEAVENQDPDVDVALAMVVLIRHGKIAGRQPWNSPQVAALWRNGKIEITDDEEAETEDDAGPPDSTTEPEQSSERSGNGSTLSSGSSSSPDAAPQEDVPSPTGTPT